MNGRRYKSTPHNAKRSDVSMPVVRSKPYPWKPTKKYHFDRLRELNSMIMETIVALFQDEDLVKRTSVTETLVIKKFNRMFPRSKVLRRTLKRRLRDLKRLGYIDYKTNPRIKDEDGESFYYNIQLKLTDSEIKKQRSNLLYFGVVD